MTKDETAKLLMMVTATYPNFKVADVKSTTNVWQIILADQDAKDIFLAFKTYARNDASGFAPSPGQLMNYKTEIESANEMTATEAWVLVRKALENCGYNSAMEFAKLPDRVKRVLGSPNRLQDMATNERFNESYERRYFEEAYNCITESDHARARFDPIAISKMNKRTEIPEFRSNLPLKSDLK